ncbi:Metal binding domain of Ada [uncultured archaeon]|nr:Metal binding domain of Ada [uncultured archaeon]
MKLRYILLALVLLVPLASLAPATDGDTHLAGDAIDVTHTSADHAKEAVAKADVFVGSIKSNKYHYPSCQWAEKIKPENKIWFSSSADARAQGYSPCKVCNPP